MTGLRLIRPHKGRVAAFAPRMNGCYQWSGLNSTNSIWLPNG